MASKAELILETAKELMITAIQANPALVSIDTSGEKVKDRAKNVADQFKTIADGVKEAYQKAV